MDNLEQMLTTSLGARRIPINLIPESCCETSILPVIDFDAVKIAFCGKKHLHLLAQLRSADCLHIDEKRNAICFIEMKNMQNFINSTITRYDNYAAYMAAFDNWLQIKTVELREKIVDSIFITVSAVGRYNSYTTDLARILNRKDVEISYMVLTNIDNEQYLEYGIGSLERKIQYPLLAGPLFSAFTILTSDFDDFIANRIGTLKG